MQLKLSTVGKFTYTTAWCAAFVTAMAIKCGLTDIIPKECSCNKMIELFKKLGSWQESDAYTPKPGDIIFYDWEDSGYSNNTGVSDHVGIVESVSGSTMTIIEGNYNDAVARRTLKVNGRYIRGYGIPKYKDSGNNPIGSTGNSTGSTAAALSFKVGDEVMFTGSKHYVSANANSGPACKSGKAKVTAISKNGKHPYHLKAVSGSDSTVYGWVDAADVDTVGDPISSSTSAKAEVAKHRNTSLSGSYKTTAALNMRTGAGTNKKIMITIPKGKSVQCYGYYNKDTSGIKWLYVVYDGKTGYCSSQYLKKD